jgi:hypothetical protein
MESIIASRLSDYNPKWHVFGVKWKDILQEANTWETYQSVAYNDLRLLEDYDKRNPAVEKDRMFKWIMKNERRIRNEKGKIVRIVKSFVLLCDIVFHACYDVAPLTSPVLVKGVMSGIVCKQR